MKKARQECESARTQLAVPFAYEPSDLDFECPSRLGWLDITQWSGVGKAMTERDRSTIIQHFRRVAMADSRVLAAFLGGSLASGTADAYSDIDIYFVIDPSAYDGFHSEVDSLLKSFGPLVFFDQHHDFGFDLVLFIFKDGVKGELGLGTIRKLKDMHRGRSRCSLTRLVFWKRWNSHSHRRWQEKAFNTIWRKSYDGTGIGTDSCCPLARETISGLLGWTSQPCARGPSAFSS